MKGGYRTGGKHDGKGLAAYDTGSKGSIDVTQRGAGGGTASNPNTGACSGPGGHGSSGTKSTSKPSKG